MGRRGDMIYHRKDGLWEARYVKGTDALGHRKYGSVYGHSYKEAKEKQQDALDRTLLYQTATPTRKITVQDLTKEWLYINRNRLKPSSYQRYQGFIKNHVEGVIGGMSVVYLTTIELHEYAQNRLNTGLSPQYVNALLTFLHSVLHYGQRQYKLPLPEIVYLTTTKKEMRVFSMEEQQRLVAYLTHNTDIYKLGILVALYTGLRIGELCALRWEDIGEDHIKVHKTMLRLNNENGPGTHLHVGEPKTNTSVRSVPLSSFLQEQIRPFREQSKGKPYFLSKGKKDITEPRVMQYQFKRYLRELNISGATFHTLRHTFATRCVECGFETKALAEVLGHASVTITLNRYVHPSFQIKQLQIEKLPSFV